MNIERFRGDTKNIKKRAISKATGVQQDITGWSFLLTVDSLENPTDSATQIFQVAGVLSEPLSGYFDFPISAAEADNLGVFYYDIQAIDSGGLKSTLDKGSFTFTQDITK